MTTKLLEPNSIPIPPHLAGLLKQCLGRSGTGFDEGAFLQQLHYWTINPETTGWISEGKKWVYNSLKSWQAQFPWMSEYGLRKAIGNLKKLGLIETAQHWISQYQRVMFYRIDYERLTAFAGSLCELVAPRCVNSDLIDVRSARTSDTETTSENSFSEQQTGVVPDFEMELEGWEAQATAAIGDGSGEGAINPGEEEIPAPCSGNSSEGVESEFPELIELVRRAIGLAPGAALPKSLVKAMKGYRDRVKPAISYLQYQQQRQEIENPVGYLYQALTAGWELSVSQAGSAVPIGFRQWFDQAKAQGLVLAAMAIDGVHHTLHVEKGWMPTERLMQGN